MTAENDFQELDVVLIEGTVVDCGPFGETYIVEIVNEDGVTVGLGKFKGYELTRKKP